MKKYRTLIISLALVVGLTIYDRSLGFDSVKTAGFQFVEMLKIVPPIFLLIGLLDVWVPRETMMKYMGKDSGVKGILISFFMGTLTAGPLIAAFPVAMVMLKKGARYANVLFFLMIWASSKLPILFYQTTTLGLTYTIVTNVTLIVVYLVGSLLFERMLSKDDLDKLYLSASNA